MCTPWRKWQHSEAYIPFSSDCTVTRRPSPTANHTQGRGSRRGGRASSETDQGPRACTHPQAKAIARDAIAPESNDEEIIQYVHQEIGASREIFEAQKRLPCVCTA